MHLFQPKKKKLPPCRFSPRASRVKGAATLPRAPRFAMLVKSTYFLDRHERSGASEYAYYNNNDELQVVNELGHHDARLLT